MSEYCFTMRFTPFLRYRRQINKPEILEVGVTSQVGEKGGNHAACQQLVGHKYNYSFSTKLRVDS